MIMHIWVYKFGSWITYKHTYEWAHIVTELREMRVWREVEEVYEGEKEWTDINYLSF